MIALKVGSPSRLCVQGEYIDNPSAAKLVAPSATAAVKSPRSLANTQHVSNSSTIDSQQSPRQHRSRNVAMYERERKRVAARNTWLLEQRRLELDVKLAEATFSPRIDRRRYKSNPPTRSDSLAKSDEQIEDRSSGTSYPRTQDANTRRFHAENGYWPNDEDLLAYMLWRCHRHIYVYRSPIYTSPPPPPRSVEHGPMAHESGKSLPQPVSSHGDGRSPALIIPMQQYVATKSSKLAKGLAIQASHRSHPSYGRMSAATLPSSVDNARAASPKALAHEARAAARSGRISAPCLNTPLASPVRMRPRTAGPVSDSWPSPMGYSEQANGDTTDQCTFTPHIAVHLLKGDRLARRLATKPASRSRLQFLASPTGLLPSTDADEQARQGIPDRVPASKKPSKLQQRRRGRCPRPAFLVEAEKKQQHWDGVIDEQLQNG